MIPTSLIFATTLALTLACAGVSIWLVRSAPGRDADRRHLLDKLLRVVIMGAATIMMLLMAQLRWHSRSDDLSGKCAAALVDKYH